MLGYAPEEMIGQQRGRISSSPTISRARATKCAWRAAASISRNFECRYVHRDGHPVPLAWTGIWSEPDRQYFFIGRDMTRADHAGGPAAPGAEDGGGRPAHRRRGARLQQHPDRHHRHDRAADRLGAGNDPKLAPIVQAIDEAASRGAQLTQRMLAFARKQPLQARNIDLNEIVDARRRRCCSGRSARTSP